MFIYDHMSKVFAVIVNYKSDEQTNSLTNNLRGLKSIKEVIMIDNNIENRGFAKAANAGIRQALEKDIDHILLVNPDVVFNKLNFEKFLNSAPADILSPVIKFKRNNRWFYDFGGRVNWVLGRPDHLQRPSSALDYVSGACMLIKREVFDKIGLFNEDYFLYFEDVDFCLRAKKARFKISVDQNTTIEHHLKEHRVSGDRFKILQNLKSNYYFIKKWVSWYFKPIAYVYFIMLACKETMNL